MSNVIDKSMLNLEQKFVLEDLIPKVQNLLRNDNYKRPEIKLEQRMFCLSGSSGVGKSTTTSLLLKEFENLGYEVLITAPTHRAKDIISTMCDNAQVSFESRTIHSYLGLKVKNCNETGKQLLTQNYGNYPPQEYDILVVDEHSMLSEELLAFIYAELEQDTIGLVLFVGDEYQILGVGEDYPAIASLTSITHYKLTQVMRQALENPIIQIATILRDGIINQKFLTNAEIKELFKNRLGNNIEQVSDVKSMLARYFESQYDIKNRACIAYKNLTVNNLNSKIRSNIIDSEDCFVPNEELTFLSAMVVDDKVVIGNNEVVTIDKLEKLEDKSLGITYYKIIDKDARLFRAVDMSCRDDLEYELQEIAKQAKKAVGSAKSSYWQRYFEIKNTFQQIAYTYCSTIFKVQGGSFDEVYIHLDELLGMRDIIGSEGLYRSLYVGATRTKDKLVLLMR